VTAFVPGLVLGVDPGERWTGVVLRRRDDLLDHVVIDRRKVDPTTEVVSDVYLWAAEEAIRDILHRHDLVGLTGTPALTLAVEDFTKPIGYRTIRPAQLIGMGVISGWLRRAFPDSLMVSPIGNSHGKYPLAVYPADLVSPGERRYAHRMKTWTKRAPQNSGISHAREAWDVAGDAAHTLRVQAAQAATRIGRGSPS
jgi:hypothetical protein